MAQKKSYLSPFKVKISKYERNDAGKPKTLEVAPLIDDKFLFLQVDPKFEDDFQLESELLLPFQADGHKWLFGCFKGNAVDSLFKLNIITDSNEDIKATSDYLENWISQGCFALILVDGNPTLELLVEILANTAFTYSGKVHRKVHEKAKELLTDFSKQAFTDDFDRKQWRSGLASVNIGRIDFWTDQEDIDRADRSFITVPELEGEFPNKLKMTISLPEIKESTGGKRGYGGGAKSYTLDDKVTDLHKLLTGEGKKKIVEILEIATTEPEIVEFAVSLLGGNWKANIDNELISESGTLADLVPDQTANAETNGKREIDLKLIYQLKEDHPEEFKTVSSALSKISEKTKSFSEPFVVLHNKTSQDQGKYLENLITILGFHYQDSYYPAVKFKSYLLGLGASKDSVLQETPTKVAHIVEELEKDS